MNVMDAAGALALLACVDPDPYAGRDSTRFDCPRCCGDVRAWVEVLEGEGRREGQWSVHVVLHSRDCTNTCNMTDDDLREHAVSVTWERMTPE